MIYYATVPLFALLVVVFQHSISGILFLNSITVEISLIMVVYAGFRLHLVKGGVLTLLLGFVMDCITGATSGFYALIYLTLFSFSFLIAPRIYAESAGFVAAMTLFCGLLEGLLIITFNYLIYGTHLLYDTLRIFIPQLIVVGVISPVLFKIFDKFGPIYGGYAGSAKRA